MTMQGSINQLLTLSAAGLKLSDIPAYTQLGREEKKLSAIIDAEMGDEESLDRLYDIQKKRFEMHPTDKNWAKLDETYPGTTRGMEEKRLSDQAKKDREMAKAEEAKKKAQTSLIMEQDRVRASRRNTYTMDDILNKGGNK